MSLLSSRFLRFALAIFLILTPWWGPALSLTGPDYTYEATEITVEDNRLVISDVDARMQLWHGISGFACSYGTSASRYCTLEAQTLNDSVEIVHPDVTYSTGGYLDAPEPYLAYYDGRVFTYNSTWEATDDRDGGHFVLTTERTSADDTLDHIARPATRPAQTAIQEGSVKTDGELWNRQDGAHVFESGGDYYVVYYSGQKSTLQSNPAFERLLTWFAVVFGCAMLFRRETDQP